MTSELQYQASVERLSDVERKLAVEVPWDEVKGRLDEAYKELSKGVTVKGFRRGKVPRKMLEKLFGEHVNSEVAQRLVQDSFTKAVTDNELAPVAEPEIDDSAIAEGEVFRYVATLQVMPEVAPKDYFGVDVIQREATVADADIDRALESKRNELTEYRAIEGRSTRHGDVLLVDLLGKVGDRPVSKDNALVELAESPMEPLPGLAAKLMDITPEAAELEINLDVPVPGDEGKTEQARLLVTIKDVKEKVVPPLDDAFAQNTGEADNLSELREKLRTKLLEQDAKRAQEEAKQRLLDAILAQNDVPVVPALVDQHLDRVTQLQMALMGLDPRSLGAELEEIKKSGRADAEKVVRTALLVESIAKKEAVEVADADVEKRLAELASERGENLAKLRSEYEKQGRVEQLKISLRETKTIELLMSKANVVIGDPGPSETAAAGE